MSFDRIAIRKHLLIAWAFGLAGLAFLTFGSLSGFGFVMWGVVALVVILIGVWGTPSLLGVTIGSSLAYFLGLALGLPNAHWFILLAVALAASILVLTLIGYRKRTDGPYGFLHVLQFPKDSSGTFGSATHRASDKEILLDDAQVVASMSVWEFNFATQKLKRADGANQLGVLNGEMELGTFVQRVHPEDREVMNRIRNQVRERIDGFSEELRIKKVDGTYGFFRIKGHWAGPDRLMGVVKDLSDRKLATQELHDKEQMFSALFESNIDPIGIVETNGFTLVDVNPAFVSLYGYQPEEIRGRPFASLSTRSEDTIMALEIAKQRGRHWVADCVHTNKQGEEIQLEGSIIRYSAKNREYLFIICHDVTKKKRADYELRQREQKLSIFFENNLLGMGESNIARQWTSVNNKLAELTGYTREELLQTSWSSLTHPQDLDDEQRKFYKLLTHEITSYIIEKRVITKRGDEIFCRESVASVKSDNGNISHFIHLVEDISDRKIFEEELRQSRRRLKQAQGIAMIGSLWFNPKSELVRLSGEARKILGMSASTVHVTRRELFKMSIPSEMGHFIEAICKLEANEPVQGNFNQTLITPKGVVKRVLLNFGVSERNGEVQEVIVTMSDITHIKEAELALAEANALKGQLLSIISHDLRSPLGTIGQLSEHLLNTELNPEMKQELIEDLHQLSAGTYSMLEELLQWSRSQQRQSVKPEPFKLAAPIADVVALHRSSAEAKGVGLMTDIPNEAAAIADLGMFKAVLRNLLSNAIKFTPAGGTAIISAEMQPNFVAISVSDTGVGMAPEVVDKIFDDNHIHTSLGTDREKGFGLGLKLVKRFVEKNGGAIHVESIEKQGTTFRFAMPRALS